MRPTDLIRVDPDCTPPPNSGESHVRAAILNSEPDTDEMFTVCALAALECIAHPAESLLTDDIASGRMAGTLYVGPAARNGIAIWLRNTDTGNVSPVGMGFQIGALLVVCYNAHLHPSTAIFVPDDAGLTAARMESGITRQAWVDIRGLHAAGSKVRRYTFSDRN